MATWDDVERIAGSLPLVEESVEKREGWRVWKVTGARGRQVVWERPMRPSDLRDLGDAAPTGESIAVRTPDMETKQLRISEIGACFDIPHFARYSGLLVKLDEVGVEDLEELIEESWLAVAPRRAVTEWLRTRDSDPPNESYG
jgi:hypothetical protein